MLSEVNVFLQPGDRVGAVRNPCQTKRDTEGRMAACLQVTYVDISSCCVNNCRNFHRNGNMLIRTNYVLFPFRRFNTCQRGSARQCCEEPYAFQRWILIFWPPASPKTINQKEIKIGRVDQCSVGSTNVPSFNSPSLGVPTPHIREIKVVVLFFNFRFLRFAHSPKEKIDFSWLMTQNACSGAMKRLLGV
jgi:hypothetical protein